MEYRNNVNLSYLQPREEARKKYKELIHEREYIIKKIKEGIKKIKSKDPSFLDKRIKSILRIFTTSYLDISIDLKKPFFITLFYCRLPFLIFCLQERKVYIQPYIDRSYSKLEFFKIMRWEVILKKYFGLDSFTISFC